MLLPISDVKKLGEDTMRRYNLPIQMKSQVYTVYTKKMKNEAKTTSLIKQLYLKGH